MVQTKAEKLARIRDYQQWNKDKIRAYQQKYYYDRATNADASHVDVRKKQIHNDPQYFVVLHLNDNTIVEKRYNYKWQEL